MKGIEFCRSKTTLRNTAEAPLPKISTQQKILIIQSENKTHPFKIQCLTKKSYSDEKNVMI